MKKNLRRAALAAGVVVVALAGTVGACGVLVTRSGEGRCFTVRGDVPVRPVAMVLGCPKAEAWSGAPSPYYLNRVAAVAALYKAGRCGRVLVSSDTDAPAMAADVVAAGVPASRVFSDTHGVRTRESFRSAAARFGITGGIVVSQRFHNERSLYIAEELGQDWVAYDAAEATGGAWLTAHARECLARVKAVADRLCCDR